MAGKDNRVIMIEVDKWLSFGWRKFRLWRPACDHEEGDAHPVDDIPSTGNALPIPLTTVKQVRIMVVETKLLPIQLPHFAPSSQHTGNPYQDTDKTLDTFPLVN